LGASDMFKSSAGEAWFFVDLDRGALGLKPGDPVKITDVEVGEVTDVRLNMESQKTYYVVELFDDCTKVYSDAKITVNAALIGGGATLQILDCGGAKRQGKASAEIADENNPAEVQLGIFEKAATTLAKFESLSSQIEGLLTTLAGEMNKAHDGSVMQKLHKMMIVGTAALAIVKTELNAENQAAMMAKLHKTIEHLKGIAKDAQPKVKSMLSRMDKMLASAEPKMDKLFDDTGKLVTGATELVGEFKKLTKGDIAKIIARLHKVSEHILTIATNFAKLSDGAENIVTVNRENIDEIVDNMVQVATNLKSASKEIRRNPWRLLYRPDDKEMHSQNVHDAARAFSNGASQLDQALAKLKGLAASHPKGVPANDPQLKKIAEQIKETFEKFTDAEKALWKELLK
jgi:ABC-type transporter Mla subunit MlaD